MYRIISRLYKAFIHEERFKSIITQFHDWKRITCLSIHLWWFHCTQQEGKSIGQYKYISRHINNNNNNYFGCCASKLCKQCHIRVCLFACCDCWSFETTSKYVNIIRDNINTRIAEWNVS